MTKVIVTQDEDRVTTIREQLEKNGGFCPCRLLHNEDTKCMCKEFREAVKEGKLGKCHCGLYEVITTTNE